MRATDVLLAMVALGLAAPTGDAQGAACLAPAAWYTLAAGEPRVARAREVLAQMAAREVVLLGEQHDQASHHHWQLQTLAALHLLRPDMVIGFESFPRRVQPALDRWVAGELTAQQFLEQSEWEKVWRFPAELYLPLFHFARLNRIPIIALNIDRGLTQAVARTGWDAVPAERKEGLSRPAPPSDAYREFLFEVYREHARAAPGKPAPADRSAPAFRFFVESQTTWDRAMAEALARRVIAERGGRAPLVVGIVGSGHLRHGNGVPHQLRDLGVASVGILLPVDGSRDCGALKPGLADAVFAIPESRRDEAPRPRLGVRLEETGGAVRLSAVLPGTLAEQAGLKRGDRIVSIAGAPVTNAGAVSAAVRAQPAGTWLPLTVQRDQETLEFVVKFPRE